MTTIRVICLVLLAGCARSSPPAPSLDAATPVPSAASAAEAPETAHPAFAAQVVQLRRDGELELADGIVSEADIAAQLRDLSADGDTLRVEVVGQVSDAWVAKVEQAALDNGFAEVAVNPPRP